MALHRLEIMFDPDTGRLRVDDCNTATLGNEMVAEYMLRKATAAVEAYVQKLRQEAAAVGVSPVEANEVLEQRDRTG